ncbi:MAG: 3' terminal RNA ribose 2'-O-methyltransferase Hen1 [Acidobacteriota bacterium]
MLLTITTTHRPATDPGYLLHKNPAQAQAFELPFGKAHVFYPEATGDRCTAALLIEIDPIGLVRGPRGGSGEGRQLDQYVNDRPYVASSFLSVAIARAFGTAMSGRSKERQELAQQEIPLEAQIAVLPCRGGEGFLRRLFDPLGYEVGATGHPLDECIPEWGDSRYFTVRLRGRKRIADLLTHLYVLIPVLDDDKHYFVGDAEVEKLLRHGGGWLAGHPERDAIAHRYLKHRRSLVREALSRLLDEDVAEPDDAARAREKEEAELEAVIRLNDRRIQAVLDVLKKHGAGRVVDLGCGEGRLLRALMKEKQITEVVGLDVSVRSLEIAAERLDLERLPETKRRRVTLLHGSLMYRDKRLAGFDAATVVEVIEHLDTPRLAAFERVLFEFARPRLVVLTTPNVEYNARLAGLPAGRFRHRDHRFEWTRREFQDWTATIAARCGYGVEIAQPWSVRQALARDPRIRPRDRGAGALRTA